MPDNHPSQASGSLPHLATLNLTACELGPAGAHQIMTHATSASAIASGGLASMRKACLADNGMGPQGLGWLLTGLVAGRAGAALCVLDLSLNMLGDEGCKVGGKRLMWLGCGKRPDFFTCPLPDRGLESLYGGQTGFQVNSLARVACDIKV